jgi:hypothetical protein
VEILRWNSNYDIRFELFNRLNTGGISLTTQEIRNCIYRDISTTFNDFLERLARNEDFQMLVDLNDEQKERMYDQELVLRFISLYEKDKDTIKTGLAQHMTFFMKKALENKAFDYEKYEKIFSEVFALLLPLGRDIFRNTQGRFTPTRYDVITIGVGENYDHYKSVSPERIKERIDQIDETIQSSGGDSQKKRITNRLTKARELFEKNEV